MKIGVKRGARGADVARLQRILRSTGLPVEAREADDQTFGDSTLEALHALQRRRGLPVVDEIDSTTLEVLLEIEQNITINVNESGSPPTKKPDEHRGTITGNLVDGDGAPLPGTRVVGFARQLRSETRLGEGNTDAKGAYAVHYHRRAAANVFVRAYDPSGSVVATSQTVFAAPAQVQIDFTTAKDGIVRSPSAFTTLQAKVVAQLDGTPLEDLKENKDTHEVRFLASAVGAPFAEVAYLFMAHVLGAKNALRPETLFGIFWGGIPASLDAALAALPDAGIDGAFMTQVFTGVLAHDRSSLAAALSDAVASDTLPASYADTEDLELNRLDDLRVQSTGTTPYIRGKTALNDLLAAGSVASNVQTAFVKAFADSGGRLGPTWKTLRADKTLSKADLTVLKTTLSVGELLTGNLPLVKDTLQRLSRGTLSSVQNLALLDQNDWIARITALDPNATSIPQVLPNDTPQQRIARFAKALAERFSGRYPSTAFVGGLTKAQTSSFTTKTELMSVLTANPSLNLKKTSIDQYVAKNKTTISAPALAELKTAQRLLRISPHYATVEALHAAGYTSAQSVYYAGRAPFIAQMTQAMGSASLAKMAFARAQMTYATAIAIFAKYNLTLNGIGTAAGGSQVPDPGTLANFSDLQALFGPLDYFECSDCQSVYSPAAYLVDLLQYLKQFTATPMPTAPPSVAAIHTAREALLFRRPEIQYIALDCSNTDVTLPYIDLVNEILEAAVAPPSTPVTLIDTAGTSAERRALPQNLSTAAYDETNAAIFPLTLPFDWPFARTTAYLAALGTSRTAILGLFAGSATGPSAAAVACASLAMSPAMQKVVNGTDGHQQFERWGFTSSNPSGVVNPKTRKPFNPSSWYAALAVVPVLLNRAGLSLQQLYQLLEVKWVTQSGVTVSLGVDPTTGLVSSDTDLMTFTGLTPDVLDRSNRFLRLLNASGLQMWELDWALELATGGTLNDAFLVTLTGAMAVRSQLNLPFQEVLCFWGSLETRDVTNHLGDEDTVTPSTYSEVFANPTMSQSWAQVFPPSSSLPLNGNPIIPTQATPTAAQSANLNATTAALGISGDDVATILAATSPPTPNALTVDNLNVLFRYARLASALSLTVSDLVLWIQLTAATPFGTTPADTLEFLRRLAVLRGTGVAVHDLDYLLRNQSIAQSTVAFTTAQSTALLRSIRDAIAKLTPAQQADAPTVATLVVAALATATGVTANVVTPVLAKTNLLPLPAATIAQLLQNPTVDPTQYPQLVGAFVTVAKAAALYTALGSTEAEFAFVVQNAATFGWLDPSALPSSPTSPYAAFEALLRALKLDKRQSARTPKLFDVLGAWLVAGQLPPDVPTAIQGTATVPGLAAALGATVVDVTAIAAALGATAPALPPASQSGTLCDMAMLASIGNALDVVARYGIRGSTLVTLASATPDASTGQTAVGAFQAQYKQSAWFGAVQPVEDGLRQARRDALVAYLLGPGGTNLVPMFTFLTSDDIFDYFLIDPEMCACAISTRLLQASLAIQQFVQQCFLNLSVQVTVDTTNGAWSEWSWRQQFRLWQANREVFLYPENYVLPELRKNASSFFTDMEGDLRQNNCDADLAESSFETYLRKLVEVSHLVVAAHYNQTMPDGSVVLHVFGKTRGTPPKWYYRTRTTQSPGSAGVWTAWESLTVDVGAADHLVPFVWDRRLHILWAIFKPEQQKANDQQVPGSGGGGTQPGPAKFWAVDFAMSELSAGQWQAKTVLVEKMFFNKTIPTEAPADIVDRPQIAFTFRASQDPANDLVITAYYSLNEAEGAVAGAISGIPHNQTNTAATIQTAVGTMSMPEAPLRVSQDTGWWIFPDPSLVDVSTEPSYPLVKTTSYMGSLTAPSGYGFYAQDLVAGTYYQQNTGTVALNVLSQTKSTGQPTTVELLGTVINARIVIPQQEAVFDSLDPFFVCDGGGGNGSSPRPNRTYLVQPEFYTVSSSPQELNSLAYIRQWTTRFAFETFYHPYARTMLRELEIGGIPQLMSRNLQTNPQAVRGWSTTFDFKSIFDPQPLVATPYPGQAGALDVGETALDFDAGSTGAYSLYNWEVFYHGPMFVASLLTQNQQFQDAQTWLEYVFNPTDTSTTLAPQRFWQMAPFYDLTAAGWVSQQITNILSNLAQGINDPATATALTTWMKDPFDPHAIASLRIAAYAKATVMKFLDNLIAWGDSLFSTYTAETVNQAEQLYILADLILGPRPDAVRLPPQSPTTPLTYAQIENQLDAFSNTLVPVENLVVAPEPPTSIVQGTGTSPTLPQIPGTPNTLFFCIPPNDQLLSYWDTVADRLYKIRHCLNLQGQAVPLPLYAPPINPLLLAEAAAAGQTPSGLTAPPPIYRFATYVQRAVELTNDVRAFGALILSALEKKDAEALALLRANQELDIQTRMLDTKNLQVTEANDQITALQNQYAVSKVRHDFYTTQSYMNQWESQALKLQMDAMVINGVTIPLDIAASAAHAIPTFNAGANGFGGTPAATMSWGGGNLGASIQAAAGAQRAVANLMVEIAGMVSTQGQYQRRSDEWTLQANIASAEMTQITSQIAAATDRLNIANSEVNVQNAQIDNAQAISDFLTSKYTNAQLYDWMVTQLTTVYAQAYQLAYGLAQQAQYAYQYELGSTDAFIQFGYWDSQHRGLTAGESLLFDLRRMEARFLAENSRELELTKHISLALVQPLALVQLVETGSCQIFLDEALFDADHPGHYFRRLRNVALTIPCVTGPYTGVNANLTLNAAMLRTTASLSGSGGNYVPGSARTIPPSDPAFAWSTPGATIATSSGQNDSGLFEVNLRDERWLPFEGQGAVSGWTLELNPQSNNFDFSTITDVVLHVRYTARLSNGDITEKKVLDAIAPPSGTTQSFLLSVKNTFGDALYAFFNPTDTTATQQVLTLPITNALVPFSNLGAAAIKDINLFFALAHPAGAPMVATFGPTGGTAATLTFNATPPAGWSGTPAILNADAPMPASPPVPPQSFTLTVQSSSVPAALAVPGSVPARLDPSKVQDIVLVVTYAV